MTQPLNHARVRHWRHTHHVRQYLRARLRTELPPSVRQYLAEELEDIEDEIEDVREEMIGLDPFRRQLAEELRVVANKVERGEFRFLCFACDGLARTVHQTPQAEE